MGRGPKMNDGKMNPDTALADFRSAVADGDMAKTDHYRNRLAWYTGTGGNLPKGFLDRDEMLAELGRQVGTITVGVGR
jgi:hypothetical protein